MTGAEDPNAKPSAGPAPRPDEPGLGAPREALADPDQGLPARMLKGERRAWRLFHDRHLDWLYRFVFYQVARNAEDAEDVTSEIMLTAVKSIARYDAGAGSLEAWLRGIARNHIARFWRRRLLEARASALPSLSLEEIEDLPGIPEAPDSLPSASELEARDGVQAALALLPARYAELLREKYVLGRSVKEIADRSRASPKAVESALARARQAFRLTFQRLRNVSGQEPGGGE